MKSIAVVLLASVPALVSAHGWVQNATIGGKYYEVCIHTHALLYAEYHTETLN